MGAILNVGKHLPADERIDGAPSVKLGGIALVVSDAVAAVLTGQKAAVDFVADAYVPIKAIGHTPGAKAMIQKARVAAYTFYSPLFADATALIANLSLRGQGNRVWDLS